MSVFYHQCENGHVRICYEKCKLRHTCEICLGVEGDIIESEKGGMYSDRYLANFQRYTYTRPGKEILDFARHMTDMLGLDIMDTMKLADEAQRLVDNVIALVESRSEVGDE